MRRRILLAVLLVLGGTMSCIPTAALAHEPGTAGPLHYATAGGEVVQVCAGGSGCQPIPIPECFTGTCISYNNVDCDVNGTSTIHFDVAGLSNLGPFRANGFVLIGPQTMPSPAFPETPLPVGPVLDFQENFHVDGSVMVNGVAHPVVPSPNDIGVCSPVPSGMTIVGVPLGSGQDISFNALADYRYAASDDLTGITTQYEGTTSAGSVGARGRDLATGGNFALAEFNQTF